MVAHALWRSEALRNISWLRPCTRVRLMQGLRTRHTLRASDLHSARATILNPFNLMILSFITTAQTSTELTLNHLMDTFLNTL